MRNIIRAEPFLNQEKREDNIESWLVTHFKSQTEELRWRRWNFVSRIVFKAAVLLSRCMRSVKRVYVCVHVAVWSVFLCVCLCLCLCVFCCVGRDPPLLQHVQTLFLAHIALRSCSGLMSLCTHRSLTDEAELWVYVCDLQSKLN